jgi:hypothetical protein
MEKKMSREFSTRKRKRASLGVRAAGRGFLGSLRRERRNLGLAGAVTALF